ncbi:rCG24525, partial [Rattus norvegicus]
MKARKSIF